MDLNSKFPILEILYQANANGFPFSVIVIKLGILKSSILEKAECSCTQQIIEWFGYNIWHLCYRASTDGWYAKDFHEKCDSKGPTIVLVKVNDYIFGGFTNTNWEGKEGMLYCV